MSKTITAAALGALAVAGAAHAQTVSVGAPTGSALLQTETLTNNYDFTLATTVFQNAAGLYTYQYDLTNLNDPSGLAELAPTVSGASDFGTSGLTFFFGGAVSGGLVTVDGSIGNDAANATPLAAVTNSAASLLAFGNGERVQFSTVSPPGTDSAIRAGQSNASQFGDYFYIQSASGPGRGDINVTDDGSADFAGTVPAVPEAGSASLLALGSLGLLGLGLRARRARRGAA